MTTLTVTPEGDVTLQKDVLEPLGVKPGDRVDVSLLPNGKLSVAAIGETKVPEHKGSIENVFGMLASPDGPFLTQEEIKAAIEDAWVAAGENRD